MAELRPPGGSLAGFPEYHLAPGTPLARIHLASRDAWWFSHDGTGRFDLDAPSGTCYLAQTPVGSFIEVFRGFPIIAASDVDARALSWLSIPRAVRLADATASRVRRIGVTGAIHTTENYEITQQWAAELAAHHFDGVRYFCGHDPSSLEIAVALFGPAGVGDPTSWPKPSNTGTIPDEVLNEVEERFGILVLPAPGA